MLISSKELRQLAQQYILDAINSDVYDVTTKTDKEKLQFLYDTFKKEFCYEQNLQRYGSEYNCFKEWIPGLPSQFNIEWTNYEIIKLAKKWGSIPENATEQQEDKIIENYWNFITSHTFQLFRKYKIT